MHQASYEEEGLDAGTESRAREQQALSRAIELLQHAQSCPPGANERMISMLYVRKLWTIFIEDLSQPHNGLPLELRAKLISIGIWIIKEADSVRGGSGAGGGDFDTLLSVHVAIRDALR
jgi:flagellar biosynthesis activator protein FlaF